jgi:hypothetical protein
MRLLWALLRLQQQHPTSVLLLSFPLMLYSEVELSTSTRNVHQRNPVYFCLSR